MKKEFTVDDVKECFEAWKSEAEYETALEVAIDHYDPVVKTLFLLNNSDLTYEMMVDLQDSLKENVYRKITVGAINRSRLN